MNIIRNLSIRTKLLTGFISIAVLLALVGVFSGFGMKQIEKNAESIYDTDLKNIDLLHSLKENILEIRYNAVTAAQVRDTSTTTEAVNNFATLQEQYKEYISTYGKSNFSKETQDEFGSFINLSNQYMNQVNDILNLASEGNYDDAITKLSAATDIREELFTTIDQMINSNQQLAEQEDTNNSLYYSGTIKLIYPLIIFGFLFAIGIGLFLSLYIGKEVKKGLTFAKALGEGDLTYTVTSKSQDELGHMIRSLDKAKEKIKAILENVMDQAREVSASSQELSATIEELSLNMGSIDGSTASIVENMESVNNISNELAVSVEQVDNAISQLATNSQQSSEEALMIRNRATKTRNQGMESQKLASQIYEEKEKNIQYAIEEGKVVDKINSIAKSISDIASQINMLALNAAIEAAHAGEQGKGFAVVAEQVKVLAEQSAGYVTNIQEVVSSVQHSVDNLSVNAKDILDFIDTRVKGDYVLLIEAGEQYEKDAIYVSNFSQAIAGMTEELSASSEEINSVVQNISGNMQDTANDSEEILSGIDELNKVMEQVSYTAQTQTNISEKLCLAVQSFKL